MKILVYPHYDNPYQTQLYSAIKANNNCTISYFDDEFINKQYLGNVLFFLGLIRFRLKGFRVFHLHWQNFPIRTRYRRVNLLISFIYTLTFIYSLKLLGYKIIWTVHNITPHERITINDLYITKILCRVCDLKIVNNEYTLKELKKLNFNANNTEIIPLGNYAGVYKNTLTQNKARELLKINPNDFVLLYFGIIRKYKGVEKLLEDFEKLSNQHKDITLLIAGKVLENELLEEILKYQNNKKIVLKLTNIPDNDVQMYFNAADVVVLPFKKITTSSSILLAFNFKKPCIYPNLGSLQELPTNVGYKYTIHKSGLLEAIEKAYGNRKQLDIIGKNGYAYVSQFNWESIAEIVYSMYNRVQSEKTI